MQFTLYHSCASSLAEIQILEEGLESFCFSLAKAFNLCGRSKIHWCSTMSIFLAIHDCKVNMFASFQRLPRVVTLRAYLLPHFFLPKSSNLWQREKVSHNLACKDILPRHDGHMACGINPYLDGKFGTGFQIGHLLDVWSCA
jgi:hypothetical protein